MEPAPTPLVVLTGFLGAGKTTLLNRVLGSQQRWRLAVIVNELGRIDIDGKLLRARAGDMVELTGGCVCHEVRTMEELWSGLDEVLARSRPERIVLETTGIAEPQAILEGLAARPGRVVVTGVVTVVDADAGVDQLERHPEARAQVEVADAILLTKMDLARPAAVAALHRALDALNANAPRAAFPPTPEATAELVPWLLDRAATMRPARGSRPHAHGQLVAASFVDDVPLLAEPLVALCDRMGSALVRVKGFVHLAGEERRGFLERAGNQTGLRLGDPWPPGARRSELVFIGEGLDPGDLRRAIWACRARQP